MNLSKFKDEAAAKQAFDIIIENRKVNVPYSKIVTLIQLHLQDNIIATPLLIKNLVRDLRESSNDTTPDCLVAHQFYLRLLKK